MQSSPKDVPQTLVYSPSVLFFGLRLSLKNLFLRSLKKN